jgi:hypothetical protein
MWETHDIKTTWFSHMLRDTCQFFMWVYKIDMCPLNMWEVHFFFFINASSHMLLKQHFFTCQGTHVNFIYKLYEISYKPLLSEKE